MWGGQWCGSGNNYFDGTKFDFFYGKFTWALAAARLNESRFQAGTGACRTDILFTHRSGGSCGGAFATRRWYGS